MSRAPLPVAELVELVELLVEAAQPIEASAPPVVDEQAESILAMVDPLPPWRGRLPPERRPLLLTQAELEALDDYSWTLPTGMWPGRRWRSDVNDTMRGRRGPPLWVLGYAVPGPTPDTCMVRWRPIQVRTTLADLERDLHVRPTT